MSSNTKKRIPSIELARILACLLVIGLHTCLDNTINGSYSFSRTFIATLFSDGVTVFWLIAGFFIFNYHSHKQVLQKTFKKLWIPATLFSIISYFSYKMYLLFFNNVNLDIRNMLKDILLGIVSFRNWAPGSVHFWYIYVYCLLVLLLPIIQLPIKKLKESTKIKNCVLLILFLILVINDITLNSLNFGQHYLSAIIPATIELYFGYFLYKKKNEIKSININNYILVGIYFAIMMLKGIIQYMCSVNNIKCYVSTWYSSLSICDAIVLIILCFRIIDDNKNSKLNNRILSVAKYTLPIYIIHPYIVKVINKIGIANMFESIIVHKNAFIFEIIYSIVMMALVFLLSYCVSKLYYMIKGKIITKNS